jgi:hypothetical protein
MFHGMFHGGAALLENVSRDFHGCAYASRDRQQSLEWRTILMLLDRKR